MNPAADKGEYRIPAAESEILDDQDAEDEVSEQAVKDAIADGESEEEALDLYGTDRVIAKRKAAKTASAADLSDNSQLAFGRSKH